MIRLYLKTIFKKRIHHVKSKAGKLTLPDYFKKNLTKVKRSEQMKMLLLENGIEVDEDGSLRSESGLYFGWKFQINGHIRFQDEEPISVHRFLTLSQ